MPDPNLKRLTGKNLLFSINAAIGTDLFRHIYVRHVDGHEFDAIGDGDLSCAYLVSGLLVLVGLIDSPHATVQTTLTKMEEAGWTKADKPLPGAVVHWPKDEKSGVDHIGFWLDENTVMSNSSKDQQPKLHQLDMEDGRQPDSYYVHEALKLT